MTALEIIEKRRVLWDETQNIEKDREFTLAVAEYLIRPDSVEIRAEISNAPELLIEMVFVIVDKEQQTVPFFLNAIQRSFTDDLNKAKQAFREGRRLHLNFLILKGRQGGFTSLITAYQLATSITQRNFSGFTLADSTDNTNTIFEDKAKFPYNNLPAELKPTEKYNSRREFLFEVLNSKWRVSTAGNKDVGRSKTINFFHGSEAAFWGDIFKIMTGLGQALTKDSIKILETTANGYNDYKELWDGAVRGENNWEAKFYAWWLTPEYRQSFESIEAEEEFKRSVATKKDWIYTRCKWLSEFIGLDWQQIYWYYNKWKDLKDDIKQEYPCSADEAFLASGRCVFDKESVIARKEYLKRLYAEKHPKRGYFIFEWNDPETKDKIKDGTIKFVEDSNGYITIYEEVKPGYPYVLGGDTKGEGSDFFTGTAINNVTGNRCATLHAQLDPDTYAHQMYCLGKYFNFALIGIEINFDLYPIKELQRLGYHKQYVREKQDTFTGQIEKKYGWKTDGNTRPMIISREIVLIRDNIDLFNDIPFLDECLTFVYDENNRPDAESGKHDDILFSDMIADAIRSEQGTKVEIEQPAKQDLPWMFQSKKVQSNGVIEW